MRPPEFNGPSLKRRAKQQGNTMEFHPLANIFPLLDGQPYSDLCADVLKNGVREGIWVLDGKILDGRNRWRAAKAMSVDCPIREYEGDDPAGFVVSLNLHRRHLNEAQRGMVAAKLANIKHGGGRVSEQAANLPLVTQAAAAEMLNVGERSVRSAVKLQAEAPAEVVQAVERGAVSLNLAAQVAALPEPEKAAVIEAVAAQPEQAREVMREAVKAHVANNSGNNEWYTPPVFIEAAREVMGSIDTDPASSEVANRTVQAAQFFSAETNGLAQTWSATCG